MVFLKVLWFTALLDLFECYVVTHFLGFLPSASRFLTCFVLTYIKQVFAMSNEFTVLIEKGEDCYLISEVVELPGCHTQAKTLDELMKRTKEAIDFYLNN